MLEKLNVIAITPRKLLAKYRLTNSHFGNDDDRHILNPQDFTAGVWLPMLVTFCTCSLYCF